MMVNQVKTKQMCMIKTPTYFSFLSFHIVLDVTRPRNIKSDAVTISET
jgi:hypothetical protein